MLALAACNYDWTYRAPDGGSATPQKEGGEDPNEDSGTKPTLCKAGAEACPFGQYCRFEDRACGTSNPEGECTAVSPSCTDKPVCTCGKISLGECEAQKSGIDIDESGTFCKGTGTFKCGLETCTAGKQFCVTKGTTSACQDFTSCTDGCKCTGVDVSCSCEESVPGEVRVECK